MDDLISRQAAISAIKEWGLLDGLSEGQAIEILADEEKVPSAQPGIIRCKDCKYFDPLTEDFDYNFCDAWAGGTNEDMFCGFAERRQDADSSGNMSGTQKALKHTETHSCDYQRTETHDWIPVTKALPRDDEDVIVTCLDDSGDTPYSYTTVAWHYKGMWVCDNMRCLFVIAWMPLPEPWRGQNETN